MMLVERYSERKSWVLPPKVYPGGFGKPAGVWVSVPGKEDDDDHLDWPTWCRSQRWHLGALAYRHTFTLDTTNVLVIGSDAAFVEFHETYTVPVLPDHPGLPSLVRVEWDRVKAKHPAGIVITPYRWKWRFEAIWYYGWDCASGCIWDPNALTHLRSEKVKKVAEETQD